MIAFFRFLTREPPHTFFLLFIQIFASREWIFNCYEIVRNGYKMMMPPQPSSRTAFRTFTWWNIIFKYDLIASSLSIVWVWIVMIRRVRVMRIMLFNSSMTVLNWIIHWKTAQRTHYEVIFFFVSKQKIIFFFPPRWN